MDWKKYQLFYLNLPEQSTVINKTDDYLNKISTFHPNQWHFVHETGMTKTSGDIICGSVRVGVPAFKVQHHASNANNRVNLMYLKTRVDFCNILNGLSNSMELLNFFDEALQ